MLDQFIFKYPYPQWQTLQKPGQNIHETTGKEEDDKEEERNRRRIFGLTGEGRVDPQQEQEKD